MNKALFYILSVFCFKLAVAQKKLVCYHTNWSQYRPDGGKFYPENIDANLCTHIIYSFAKISNDGLAAYEWNDEDTDWSKGMYSRTMNLKAQNPSLKILLAVGGWNHGSAPFSNMVHNAASRSNFVQNSVRFLKRTGFDGLDLDWEYPGDNNGRPTDKELFTTLVKELKAAFQPQGLLLTAAVPVGKKNIDNGYEIAKISQDLDWINLMAYDFHGTWETFTGHNSPLYKRADETDPNQATLNVDFAVNYWLANGAPKDKLILGMGTYGRSFRLNDPTRTKPGDRASGGSSAGQFTREAGFLSYYEICQKISQGWTKKWDSEALVPYAYQGSEWVGFDDIQSLKEKVDYVKSKGLGGAMFWTLDLDDFNGQFCGQGKYPLINSVKQQLNNGVIPVVSSTANPTIITTAITTVSTTSASTTLSTTSIRLTTTTTTASLASIICKSGDGYYEDLESGCVNYYICAFTGTIRPIVKLLTCATGTLFDKKLEVCNLAKLVTCGGISTTTTTTTTKNTTTTTTTTTSTTPLTITTKGPTAICAAGDGYYQDIQSNCIDYFYCVFSNTPFVKAIRYSCPNGLKFDNSIIACGGNVQCGQITQPTTTTIKTTQPSSTTLLTSPPTTARPSSVACSNGDGYYIEPKSGCTRFVLCLFQGTEYAEKVSYECPTGTLFDTRQKQCVWTFETNCSVL